MVTPISPVGPAPPLLPSGAGPNAGTADTAAQLAGLPTHSPLTGLRQDPGVTDRVTGPGRHATLRTALLHRGGTLDGLRQWQGDHPAPEPPT